jgi:hypothetical protein
MLRLSSDPPYRLYDLNLGEIGLNHLRPGDLFYSEVLTDYLHVGRAVRNTINNENRGTGIEPPDAVRVLLPGDGKIGRVFGSECHTLHDRGVPPPI